MALSNLFNTSVFIFLLSSNLCGQSAFLDISNSSQVDFEEPHSGIAVCDFNNDKKEDIYLSVRNGENKLYRNLGDEYFVEVSKSTGVDCSFGSRSSIFIDVNNDGWQDLYVGNPGAPDVLYLNQGDGTFIDISVPAGIENWGYPLSVNAADINNDGWIDIYISNSVLENVLYRNNGDLTFTDIVYPSNTTDPLISMGSIFFDYDNDGDQDLYLVHDSRQANILYQNNGQGYFTDVSTMANVNYKGLGMGVDVGDINNDGWLDLYVTNLFENVLFVNNKNGGFTDITSISKVDDFGMGWGTNIFDYNNDGLMDIYVANDSRFSPYPNVLYQNKADFNFERLSDQDPICSMFASYGSAITDFDMDGRLDVAVANAGSGEYSQLFKNQLNDAGNWIGFLLEGVESNRNAIGARIEIVDAFENIHIREVTAGSGYASQSSYFQHIGLGDASSISEMKIKWPSGLEQDVESPDILSYYSIKEGEGPVLFFDATSSFPLEERNFNLKLFPNPASDHLNLSFELQESINLDISILSIDGQKVQDISVNKRYPKGQFQEDINLSSFNPGTYFFKISTRKSSSIKKFIVI